MPTFHYSTLPLLSTCEAMGVIKKEEKKSKDVLLKLEMLPTWC